MKSYCLKCVNLESFRYLYFYVYIYLSKLMNTVVSINLNH